MVSQDNVMVHVCNIYTAYESDQMVHYLKDMTGSNDSKIIVHSPVNIRQCRSTKYEYGIVNNIKSSQCSILVNCEELKGGRCNHDGGYTLHLDLGHAWSAKPSLLRGSERICENKLYHRTLIHNDMIKLRMELYDDPQDRTRDETFTCIITRQCIPLGSSTDNYGNKSTHNVTFEPEYRGKLNRFYCGNNQNTSISLKWQCDGEQDCEDGSDEVNCLDDNTNQYSMCTENEFNCSVGMCIPNILVCDGHDDCLDQSDEHGCINDDTKIHNSSMTHNNGTQNSDPSLNHGYNFEGSGSFDQRKLCGVDSFKCYTGDCVPIHSFCNGVPDCPDSSDELGCLLDEPMKDPWNVHCQNITIYDNEPYFLCKNGVTSITLGKLCNGRIDCPDYSDEGQSCKALCKNNACHHSCILSPVHAMGTCFCNAEKKSSGYQKHEIIHENVDDECRTFGRCSQECLNTKGSYNCSCKSDYIDVNGTCKAIGTESELLFFAVSNF